MAGLARMAQQFEANTDLITRRTASFQHVRVRQEGVCNETTDKGSLASYAPSNHGRVQQLHEDYDTTRSLAGIHK